jgi:hypothetical protein
MSIIAITIWSLCIDQNPEIKKGHLAVPLN